MQEVYEFLKKAGTYYLAAVEGDQPRVRPFGTADIFEGRLYIRTGKVKEVSKQLQKNPKTELCAFDGERWLRVPGELVRDDRTVDRIGIQYDYNNPFNITICYPPPPMLYCNRDQAKGGPFHEKKPPLSYNPLPADDLVRMHRQL